jgi:uncharacterized lipoprotein YmbA
MANRSILKTGLVALCALVLSACLGGRSPSVQFYNLSATEAESTIGDMSSEPAVGVGPAIFPKSLRRSQVVIRTGPNTVELDEFNRWSGSLSAEFLDALGANLGARLGTERVAVYPAEARYPLDYRITLDVDRFDGAPGGSLVLSVRWTVSGGDDETVLAVKQTRIETTVTGDSVADLVRAHDAAVADLSRRIADTIRAL